MLLGYALGVAFWATSFKGAKAGPGHSRNNPAAVGGAEPAPHIRRHSRTERGP
jgi:hypothetical protein